MLCIVVMVCIILCLGIVFGRYLEKRKWNGGVCARSGRPWKMYDAMSGDRFYRDGHGNNIIISYNVDNVTWQS